MSPRPVVKAAYGSPCNGCGLCCQMEVCGIGLMVDPTSTAPCQFLRFTGEKYRCAIVEAEESSGMPRMIAESLGIGKGCCSDDPIMEQSP